MKYLFLLIATLVTTIAQPVLSTNIVRLDSTTRLTWRANPEPDIHGYNVNIMPLNTNVYLTGRLSTNLNLAAYIQNSGAYSFNVKAVNTSGMESLPSSLSTNLTKAPSQVIELLIKVDVTVTTP